MVLKQTLALLVALAAPVQLGCDSGRIPLVAETDDEAADFGRTALIEAVVKLSETPKSAQAYAAFARRVSELQPLFNREVRREAELRLIVLAIGPLETGLRRSSTEQMQEFATTVWPTILSFPSQPGETPDAYVRRLCAGELALTCNNVVSEYWPQVLNARVWRTLKSRVDVAYDRCQWCEEDPSFGDILDSCRQSHLRLELIAQEALEIGQPSAWAKAGPNAEPLSTELVVSFGSDGLVKVKDRAPEGGNWRQAIGDLAAHSELLALHLRPERMVSELLEVYADAREAGFTKLALVVRAAAFPYTALQYRVDPRVKSYRDLGVRNSDSIQILVQALDLRASKAAPQPGPG